MSNLVLYRKYRPQKFAEVVNQEHVKTTLANAVANNRIGHAYLFTGPRGVGKTTLARIFARAINCTHRKNSEPCNECEICQSFVDGTSLDLLEIDAASNRSIENVRNLIEHLQFSPTQAAYKVIIIDEVHMLTKEAFNALLKTLEEPPKHAVFILATTEIHKVPVTIVSRTQRFDFKKASISDIVARMKFVCADNHLKITDGALVEIGSAADGSFRDALSLLDQVTNYAESEVTEDLVEQVLGLTGTRTTAAFLDLLISGQIQLAVNFISDLMYAGRDLYQFEKDFLEYLRKILLTKVGSASDFGFTKDLQDILKKQSEAITLPQLTKIIQLFQKAETEIKWATIQSLPLELAAVEATSIVENIATIARSEATRQSDDEYKIATTQQVESRDGSSALAMIIEKWPQILEKLKDYNHALVASLKLALPIAVEGRELVVVFPYKFHKDAIEARKNRIVVDQVIEEVTGLKLMVKPQLQKEQKTENESIESALKIMGGEVE